jgi:hypothetical protein
MSMIKLFLSGLLVAAGLILGAFTLQGYLDPDWALRQAQAAKVKAAERAAQTASTNALQGRTQFVTVTRIEQPAPEAKARPAAPAKARVRPDAAAADASGAARQAPKKKEAERPAVADKAKKAPPAPQPQQASFDWPWLKQLLGNN